jgi:hypothetical protein
LYFRTRAAVPTEQWFRLSLAPAQAPTTPLAADQADPCRGMYPSWLWQPDQTIVAKSLVFVPADLAAGDYVLRVDMFDLSVGPEPLLEASGEQALMEFAVP